jgi:hypothetical protein
VHREGKQVQFAGSNAYPLALEGVTVNRGSDTSLSLKSRAILPKEGDTLGIGGPGPALIVFDHLFST